MKYTTIVFDCDGTLLNTATDLANAVNHVLRTHNFPEKSLAEVKAALGNAVTYLMRQCLPSTVADHELEPYIEEFKAYYGEHLKDTTAPYPGILDMLDELREQGYKLAIVSNKIQEGVTPLNKEYFGDRLPVAIGERPGLQRKPAPDMVLQALKELNSGLLCLGVTWGFREESLHQELGVTHIARKAEDIVSIVGNLNK